MRLSEAIALGRMLIAPCVGGSTMAGDPQATKVGCALDMAVKAVGGSNWHDASNYFPWLRKEGSDWEFSKEAWRIVQMFDLRVMKGKMTLDELIDYVRSVEPAEIETEFSAPLNQEELQEVT
jgi:hypothetical protein